MQASFADSPKMLNVFRVQFVLRSEVHNTSFYTFGADCLGSTYITPRIVRSLRAINFFGQPERGFIRISICMNYCLYTRW